MNSSTFPAHILLLSAANPPIPQPSEEEAPPAEEEGVSRYFTAVPVLTSIKVLCYTDLKDVIDTIPQADGFTEAAC